MWQGDGARDPARRQDRDGDLDCRRYDARGADSKNQLLLLAAAARGLRKPHDLGMEGNVIERFAAAGIPGAKISFARDTYIFKFPGAPSAFVADFRNCHGPTMNAFAAAEQSGKSADLQRELEALFERENKSQAKDTTSIPATFLKVTVAV